MNTNSKSKIGLFLYLLMFLSFVGGCTAKLIYQTYNSPDWLNSIVVGIFVGLTFFSGGVGGITLNFADSWKNKSFEKKGKAVFSIIVGILFILISMLIFWKVFINLYKLLS